MGGCDKLQVAVIRMNDLRTPVILFVSTVVCYVVSGVLTAFTLDLASSVVQILTYCSLALLVSWLLLHYGSGSEDVISAIDSIANYLMAPVSICVYSFPPKVCVSVCLRARRL